MTAVDLEALQAGNRRALARAITLVESSLAAHRESAQTLLETLLPKTGNSIRVGISGVPGVGKSTFIEAFGLYLISQGKRVAVLAVDPSSPRTGGSILGDKTRMEMLSRREEAFIRPSPAAGALGGVAQKTRETMLLCEAAGYDVILVETVGVGQSEYQVAGMVDFFMVLMLPGGGDELQGIKRGIMELADALVINKADGDLKPAATRTCADYAGALRLLRKRPQDPPGFPKAMMVSAAEETGLPEAWAEMQTLTTWRRKNGFWNQTRAAQARYWFDQELRQALLARLEMPNIRLRRDALGAKVEQGELSPAAAAQSLLASLD